MNLPAQNPYLEPPFSSGQSPRICMLSARQIRDRVTDAYIYELEDLICKFDHVDIYTYDKAPDWSRRIYTIASKATRSTRIAKAITPNFTTPHVLEQKYDLFIFIARNIFELTALQSIKNWRSHCKKAVCYVIESWNNEGWLHKRRCLLEPLKQFDQIFLGTRNSVEAIADYTQRPCSYLLSGLDTLRFCPYPLVPTRTIDIASLGRRSEVTHQALLNLASTGKIFYYFDTGSNMRMINPREHRIMYANLLKRSRYFITNYANANEPEKAKCGQEVGYRFFEGVAAGAVLIGCPPKNELFDRYFGWEDAVIPMPFDAPDVGELMAQLDQQPERLDRIRRANVVNSLRNHDWLYSWREVLDTVGLPSTAEMMHREQRIQRLVNQIVETESLERLSVA